MQLPHPVQDRMDSCLYFPTSTVLRPGPSLFSLQRGKKKEKKKSSCHVKTQTCRHTLTAEDLGLSPSQLTRGDNRGCCRCDWFMVALLLTHNKAKVPNVTAKRFPQQEKTHESLVWPAPPASMLSEVVFFLISWVQKSCTNVSAGSVMLGYQSKSPNYNWSSALSWNIHFHCYLQTWAF